MNCQGAPVPATWASLSKPEGSMAIGGSDVVTVSLNSIGMLNGEEHSAEIKFVTNDPNNELYVIPLRLTIGDVSVAESANSAYKVYPNPATTSVTLEGENLSHVAIYNVAGQLVRVVRLDGVVNSIDMNVEDGIYFFSIFDNQGNNTVQRVVISK